MYVITGLFRVGVNTIREKKSYFFSVLNSLNTLLLSSLHGLRRNICDNGTVFVIFFCSVCSNVLTKLGNILVSRAQWSFYKKKGSKKCRQVLRKICQKDCVKNCQDSSWLAGCPWNQWKFVSHSQHNLPCLHFIYFKFLFANFHCSYFSVPLSDLFANTLKTE